jgi:hypothetical protein
MQAAAAQQVTQQDLLVVLAAVALVQIIQPIQVQQVQLTPAQVEVGAAICLSLAILEDLASSFFAIRTLAQLQSAQD